MIGCVRATLFFRSGLLNIFFHFSLTVCNLVLGQGQVRSTCFFQVFIFELRVFRLVPVQHLSLNSFSLSLSHWLYTMAAIKFNCIGWLPFPTNLSKGKMFTVLSREAASNPPTYLPKKKRRNS